MFRQLGAVAAIAAAVWAVPGTYPGASAQTVAAPADDAEGYLTAFACGTLGSPLVLQVETLDDSKPALRLRRAMIEALERRNAVLSSTAKMRLSLAAKTIHEAPKTKGRDLGEVRAGTGDIGDDDVSVRMNVWSNKRDSILGGRKDGVESLGVDEVRVTVAVHDKTDGKCLWQGEAVHELNGRDPTETSERLLPFLADAIGKTVKKQPLQLE